MMYPAFMSPYKSTVIEVPVEKEVYISTGNGFTLPLGTKLAKIINVSTEFINISRKTEDKNISIKLGDPYVIQSKRSKYSKI